MLFSKVDCSKGDWQVHADANKLEISNASSVDLNTSCSKYQMRGPMLPRFRESECGIDAYLERFERLPVVKIGVETTPQFI